MKHRFSLVTGLAIFLLLALPLLPLPGQSNTARLFTAADGLPISEMSSVCADRQGRLWVSGSGGGISVYEGKGFRSFTTRDGLLAMTFHAIWEDKNGLIWALHLEYGLNCLIDGHWQSWNFAALGLHTPLVAHDQHSSTTFVLDAGLNLYRIEPNQPLPQPVETLSFDLRRFQLSDFQCWDDGRSMVLVLDQSDRSAPREMWIRQAPGGWQKVAAVPWKIPPSPTVNWWVLPGEGIFLFQDGVIQRYDGQRWAIWKTPAQDFDSRTKSLLQPRVVCSDHLCFVRPRSNHRVEIQQYDLRFKTIRTVTVQTRHEIGQASVDRGGHVWLATRGGLYRVFPYFLSLTEADPGMITDLHALAEDRAGNIWLASYKEGMVWFDGQTLHPSPPDLEPFRRFMPGSFRDQGGNLYFSHEGRPTGIVWGRPGGKWGFHPIKEPTFYMGAFKNGDLGLGLGERQGVMRLPLDALTGQADFSRTRRLGKAQGLMLQNTLGFCEDRYGRLWMGRSSQGLAVWLPDRDTILNFIRRDTNPYYGAMTIVEDHRGNLWFATNQGLRFWPNRKAIDERFDPVREFVAVGRETTGDRPIHLLGQYSPRYLVFGNTRGFGLLDLETFYRSGMKEPRIYFFTDKDGYTGGATEQNALLVDSRQRIWIGCDAGAVRFDPAFYHPDTFPAVLELDRVEAGGQTWSGAGLRERLRLNATDRSVHIVLKAPLNLYPCDHLEYRYRRTGAADTAWTSLGNATAFRMENLGVGTYKIEIQSIKNAVPTGPLRLEFEIPLFFWQELYFWFSLIAGMVLLGLFLWRRERLLQLEKRERNKLEIQLIVNQLNPHFINNALQLVQVRVYNDQESVRVIDKLARNIHLIFQNSRDKKPFYTLAEEMLLVRNYLYIQHQRFGSNLHYALPEEDELHDIGWVQVPLMQIQIHVENAIEHGIRNQPDGRGRVTVAIADAGPVLNITVEDSGVGRVRAHQLGSRGNHQGTRMLAELHVIFNRHNPLPIRSYYEDDIFRNDAGEAYGTRVHLSIPKSYRYDLD